MRDPFDAPIGAIRPALFARGLYTLLALDAWIEMIPHAGRYGIGGFNVAHFAWLDSLLPLPSSGLYVALLTASGVLAACCALGPHRPLLRRALVIVYTLAWAVSMHDSYQHHYLLSWLLVAAAAMKVRPADCAPDQLVREPAYVLGVVTCIVVYTFTALSKLAPAWRDGKVLRRLSGSRPAGARLPGSLDAVRDTLGVFGVHEAVFWRGLALIAVCVQLAIALGYLASIGRDAHGARRLQVACAAGLSCALLFHGATELSGLFAIGWFSAYMIWLALVALTPHAVLARVLQPIRRALDRGTRRWTCRGLVRWLPLTIGVGAGLAVARYTGIPGLATGFALATALALWGGHDAFRAQLSSVTLSALCFTTCLCLAPVAFDYHRRLAGELLAMGREAEALAAYREAERVAPVGHSRQARIRSIERSLWDKVR